MIIYKTTNIINGKIYVGKDESNNPAYLGSGYALKPAIKKYGKENFRKRSLKNAQIHTSFVKEKDIGSMYLMH